MSETNRNNRTIQHAFKTVQELKLVRHGGSVVESLCQHRAQTALQALWEVSGKEDTRT